MVSKVLVRLFVVLFCLPLAAASQAQPAGTRVSGLAYYVELRHTFYLAALHLSAPSRDAAVILASDRPQAMEILVTTERWSPYNFASQWNNALVINNDPSDLQSFDSEVSAFFGLIKDYLRAGDRILIERDTAGGTRVWVNGQTALKVERSGFFRLLLRTWVGSRPPSSQFRTDILAQSPSSALISAYEELKSAADALAVESVQPDLLAAPEAEPALESASTAGNSEVPDSAPSALNDGTSRMSGVMTSPPPAQTSAKAAKPALTLSPRQNAIRLRYESRVLRQVLAALTYPEAARQSGYEGDVILELLINTTGEVDGVSMVYSSGHSVLNQAALSAVDAAAPFNQIPADLPDEPLRVRVPLNFVAP